ncbi:MAG: helix-turn-helix transcriptional regulator [Verrucomicrobiales bacterium]|nr:helix-turn-helix transcriptional regulator [Verrucomicrobiales bacterium]
MVNIRESIAHLGSVPPHRGRRSVPVELEKPPSSDDFVLELQGAVNIPELWESICRLVHAAVDADFACLCLRPFEMVPGTIFRDRHPFTTSEQLQRFNRLSVLQPYLLAHPGIEVVRMSDVIAEEDLVETPFYRECMEPCGYLHVAAMAFWNGTKMEAVVCAHRSREAGAFRRSEVRALQKLHASVAVAIRRVLRLHREYSVRLSLERFMQRVPLATVLLSWDLEIIYENRAACEAVLVWEEGREKARQWKPPARVKLPTPLLALCREAKEAWRPMPSNPSPGIGPCLQLRHPTESGFLVEVRVLQLGSNPGHRPTLLMTWEDLGPSENRTGEEGGRKASLGKLARLSPCERELALLTCEGLGTADLATRLGKSPLTIKKQLQSIYRKLEVPGRTRLMAILR